MEMAGSRQRKWEKEEDATPKKQNDRIKITINYISQSGLNY
jgi:hypothetical protein